MTSEFLPFARPRPGTTPPYYYPDYQSTQKRAPRRPPIRFEHTLSEATGPDFADGWAGPDNTDLTRQHQGEPLGERIIVTGRVLDEDGRPVPGTLIELWQCNAAGRYHHLVDQHDAPLDPNFTGAGQVVTGRDGGYRFLTIKPGAYPWRNTPNAW
ncbi:MAG: protocatechuate 3,4-dioxygenase subunit beta, partial [Alphaproteobacteria bacterium]